MTSVGGVDLEISDNNVVAGAVFLMSLEGFGTADWSAEPPYVVEVDGQRVRLINGHAAFVSLRTGCSEPHAVMAQALEVAQRALDLEAARGQAPRSFKRVDEQHIVWWRTRDTTVLRLVVSRPLTVNATVGASGAHGGSARPPWEGSATWNAALRFFRLTQLADDIFDAYRNAFLALEAILDASAPAGGPGGERAWLKFALTHVLPKHGIEIKRYLIDAGGGDPVDQFLDEQYSARRCALFHAKSSRGALLPGVVADRHEVSAALEPLIRLDLDLNRSVLGIIFPAGGMTVGGLEMVMDNLAAYRYEVAVLHDPNPDQDLTRDQLDSRAAQRFVTCRAGRLDSVGREQGFLANAEASSLAGRSFNTIISYTAMPIPDDVMLAPSVPTGLLSRHVLPPVDAGTAEIQVLVRWLLDNRQMPRSRFTV